MRSNVGVMKKSRYLKTGYADKFTSQMRELGKLNRQIESLDNKVAKMKKRRQAKYSKIVGEKS